MLDGDTHDVWIFKPRKFYHSDDGGGEVTFNGETFTERRLLRVSLSCISRQISYNIYGAQQDNSSIRIASRSSGA
jgi:hypothetical protein